MYDVSTDSLLSKKCDAASDTFFLTQFQKLAIGPKLKLVLRLSMINVKNCLQLLLYEGPFNRLVSSAETG